MNIATATLVAEIVGATGVIASLLFLALETRKSTLTMRASLSNDVLTATAELNDVLLADPELRRVTSKATDPSMSLDDFSLEEKDAVIYLGRALFMRFEGIYMLYKQGLVELLVWESRRGIAAGLIKLPIWKEYWETEQKIGMFTKEFVAAMNSGVASEFPPPISASVT